MFIYIYESCLLGRPLRSLERIALTAPNVSHTYIRMYITSPSWYVSAAPHAAGAGAGAGVAAAGNTWVIYESYLLCIWVISSMYVHESCPPMYMTNESCLLSRWVSEGERAGAGVCVLNNLYIYEIICILKRLQYSWNVKVHTRIKFLKIKK